MKALPTEDFQRVAISLLKGYSSKDLSKASRYIAATRCACRAGPRRFAPLIDNVGLSCTIIELRLNFSLSSFPN